MKVSELFNGIKKVINVVLNDVEYGLGKEDIERGMELVNKFWVYDGEDRELVIGDLLIDGLMFKKLVEWETLGGIVWELELEYEKWGVRIEDIARGIVRGNI
jgi:hypothetical protein